MPPDEALFDIYTPERADLRHLLLHVPLCLHPGRQRARPHARASSRTPRRCWAAKTWETARRITVPLALPALLAGALVAFLQAMNLFGSPAILAIPAGFHTLTTAHLEPVPVSAEARAGGRGLAAAAGADGPAAARPGDGARPARLCGASAASTARRGLIRLGWLRWPAVALGAVRARHAAVPALRRAVQLGLLARRVAHRRRSDTITLHNFHFTFLELSSTMPALKNTFLLATAIGDAGRAAGAGDRLHRRPQGGARLSRAGLPRHRAARHSRHRAGRRPVPRLYAAAARALRHAVDPADRLRHDRAAGGLSAARSAFHAVHPELEEASRILGATRLRHAGRHHRAAAALGRDRDLVLHLRRRRSASCRPR